MLRKKTLTSLAISLSIGFSASAMENEPIGFRGIKWGDPISSIQGLVEVSEQEYIQKFIGAQLDIAIRFPLKTYIRNDDKIEFDGTPVLRTVYTFYMDRFVAASIRYKNSKGMHPKLGWEFPNTDNENKINASLTKNFGPSDFSKLSFMEKLNVSNSGRPTYYGETTEINNKCFPIGNHGQQLAPPWLFNCELQFSSSALYKQAKQDFSDYVIQTKANQLDAIAKEKAREQAKPDF